MSAATVLKLIEALLVAKQVAAELGLKWPDVARREAELAEQGKAFDASEARVFVQRARAALDRLEAALAQQPQPPPSDVQ